MQKRKDRDGKDTHQPRPDFAQPEVPPAVLSEQVEGDEQDGKDNVFTQLPSLKRQQRMERVLVFQGRQLQEGSEGLIFNAAEGSSGCRGSWPDPGRHTDAGLQAQGVWELFLPVPLCVTLQPLGCSVMGPRQQSACFLRSELWPPACRTPSLLLYL